jgi:hypothetical protein
MPGYLTSFMVLTEADQWLGDLEEALGRVASPSELEKTVRDLAHKVRQDYLRLSTYSPRNEGMPPSSIAKIDRPPNVHKPDPTSMGPKYEDTIGNGITQYAFAGAIAHDIPAAGNILALNQKWVANTMHRGSPRRAWQNAGTAKFVLDSVTDQAVTNLVISLNTSQKPALYQIGISGQPDQQLIAEFKKLRMALSIGQLASVASHVIVQPFIRQWSWQSDDGSSPSRAPWPMGDSKGPHDPTRFAVQIDAKMAQAYYQRDSLHQLRAQSWTAYLPDDDKAIHFMCECWLQAFNATYDNDPKELACNVPTVEALEAKYTDLKPLVDQSKALRDKISGWSGWPLTFWSYDDLFPVKNERLEGEPAGIQMPSQALDNFLLNDKINKLGDLVSELQSYPCSTPTLNRDFLKDGFKNTRNWALDAGYDHDPWVVTLIMSVLTLFTAADPIIPQDSYSDGVNKVLALINIGVLFNTWDATTGFDASAAVKATNLKAWIDNGLANEIIWFDILDNSYGSCGPLLFLFNAVLTGISAISFDGLFGQNADALDGLPKTNWRKLYILFNDLFSPLVLFPFIFGKAMPDAYRKPYVRWPLYWLVNVGMDGFEELYVAYGDEEKGLQGDQIGLRIWYLRIWMVASYILACLMVLGIKSGDTRSADQKLVVRDFLLMLIFPLMMVLVVAVGKSGFEGALLKSLTGVDWPSGETDLVNSLLPVAEVDGVKSLIDGTGQSQPVALFAKSNLTAEGDNFFYPEAPAGTKWADRTAADEKARKDAHKASDQPYTLKKLLDRAKILTGLLSMALVNFDQAEAKNKVQARAKVFKDWNLDYRAEDEWNDLMETTGGTVGLLQAAEQWVSDLKAARPSDPGITQRLSDAFLFSTQASPAGTH